MGSAPSRQVSTGPSGTNSSAGPFKAADRRSTKRSKGETAKEKTLPNGGSQRKSSRQTKSSNSVEFEQACLSVFRAADKDGNGSLDAQEFWNVLHSQTLNLNLSDSEVNELRDAADTDKDGVISYEEFIPVVKELLRTIYARKDDDWNDWSCLTDPETGNTFYLNKRTGETSRRRPTLYHEERREVASFENFVLPNGNEITTYLNDDGTRLYMDWDENEWKPVPAEWAKRLQNAEDGLVQPSAVTDSSPESDGPEAEDPRVGEMVHPHYGALTTYLLENTRNSRLYYDSNSGEWQRMPLEWEFYIPEVKEAVQAMSDALPHWNNGKEQLLCLRECDYNVFDAIAFGEINFAAQSKDQGRLSAADLARLAHLEKELARTTDELNRLKREQQEQQSTATKQLIREKTKVEGLTARREQMALETQEQMDMLTRENTKLRERVSQLEQQQVAVSADADRIRDLERQIEALQDEGEHARVVKDLQGKMEQMRMENVALKLKVQNLKDRVSQATGNAVAYKALRTHLQAIRREHGAMRQEFQELQEHMSPKLEAAVTASRSMADNMRIQLQDITAKYLKEQTQRKLLYNKVQELRGNIRVFCRVRQDTRGPCALQFPSATELVVPKLQGGTELIEFEHCYGPNSKQETIFSDTRPIILSCVDGYNVCIIAYGQTGSGKTYTMMGPLDNPGVNRRAVTELVQLCAEREEVDYEITASMMEVYNEHIYDLLTESRESTLSIRQAAGRTFVDGAKEVRVQTQQEIFDVMEMGDRNRSVGATQMNTDSSRSHLLFRITVKGVNKISKQTTQGTLTLVDLAGSERVSKTDASGDRLVEAAAINKSLSALGQVFKALASNAPHVPYRNSKLTHALSDSLGGDSKTAVFVNVSPLETNLSETLMTLKFGQGIRKIELGPAKRKTGPPKPK